MSNLSSETAPQIAAFGSLGILTVTQDLSGRVQQAFPEFNREIVAEETLCLVSALTAECIGSMAGSAFITDALATLRTVPYSYRDYLLGQLILTDSDAVPEGFSENIGRRIGKDMNFYSSHLSRAFQSTSTEALQTILLLWMGRISPSGCKDEPLTRLARIDPTDLLQRHVTLMTAFARHCLGSGTPEQD